MQVYLLNYIYYYWKAKFYFGITAYYLHFRRT